MAERPIIFSAPMVNAILAGRKSQTRRVLRDQPGELDRAFVMDDGSWHVTDSRGMHMSPIKVPYAVGDRLWVREAWKPHSTFAGMTPRDIPRSNIFYRADDTYAPSNTPWRSPIHMPRWASRLTLTVTDVRVQRVQDISPEDIEAEGVIIPLHHRGPLHDPHRWRQDHFRPLWESLHGPGSWDANPWVTATSFTAERRNIDGGAT